jgi:hypothetical protein
MIQRTTIRLHSDLMARAKRKAAAEGRTLTSLIEDGLRLVVSEERKPPKRKRVLPRISKATGGPRPGIDLTDFSALQEMDDLEYVERMKRFR